MMPGRAHDAATAEAKVTWGELMWFSSSRAGPDDSDPPMPL
jgi:hypothetical protein